MSENNKPVYRLRYGNVVAAVWANNSQAGYFYNTTFTRLYKDGDSWKSSNNFGRDDLLTLGKVADKAQDWIFAAQRECKE